ncbi:MAG: aminotransferase class I/II-fold pyridoxal phosphate-dependent enzyme [Flavobacteriaceae bacterium]|jgi:methionine aminotransferase|nr:aminotransferase class I/II-fold pyridoxal phosphate-dependent enzyme [Flavobacteriaceae bacterium]
MISKLPNITTSIFTVMSKMASDYNALNLSQGFPNFKSDPFLIELVNKAMEEGYNQYAPMSGYLELREIISNKTTLLHSKKYNPNTEIIITAGATQAIFTAIATVVNKDDEAIIFNPAYDCYGPAIELFGGITIPVQLKAPFYKPNWEEVEDKITDKTKLIIVNSPHNPSGMIFSEDDMRHLQFLSEKYNLIVISDEVYEHIIFDGFTHYSVAKYPELASRSFIVASFGKTFHNTGWKTGYCLAPENLMNEFKKIHQYNVFSVNSPIQKALSAYLKTPEHYLSLSSFYQQKRDVFLELIKDSKFKIIPSKGTYFQMLDFSDISNESDLLFTERLTKDYKIATIPTSVFNENQEDFKQIRVCFAKTEETLILAAKIINTIS